MRAALGILMVSSMTAASADTLDELEPQEETPEPQLVSVRGTLRGHVATFVTRHVVDVDGPTHEQRYVSITIPDHGIVTRATVTRDGRARRLDLVPATLAQGAFNAIATKHVGREARSAVLITGERGRVDLGIASPRPGQITIDLEISTPTCFFANARQVRVPEEWVPLAPPALRSAVRAAGEDALSPCGTSATDTSWLAFPSAELARRRSGDRFGATAARLAAGHDHLVRVEVDVDATLADAPRDLATAIVLDGSRSLDDDEREAQRALIDAYLARAGDTRVQVIAFSREARALLPGWVPASQARASIDRELRALAPRNGSNLDLGLAEARAWLERVDGTRRILVITDERMAQRLLDLGPTGHQLPARALVHTVALSGRRGSFSRDGGSWLAPLAAATGGMSVRVGPPSPARALDATRLLRPTSLDDVRIQASGWSADAFDAVKSCGGELREGGSCTWWGHGDATSGSITIEGLVWGTRITRVVHPDPRRAREVARELSVRDELKRELAPELQARVEELARAVNSAWSLYRSWGGRAGYGGSGGILGPTCGCDSFGLRGLGALGQPRLTATSIGSRDLERQLELAIAHCKLEDARATARVELTQREIADVRVTLEPRQPRPDGELSALHACITEAIWSAEPEIPHPVPHATHTVTFGR